MRHLPRPVAVTALGTAVAAAVSTALAELLGGAIALKMLFGLPLAAGTLITLVVVLWLLFTNSYRRVERLIIGFVSLIGLSFVFELSLVSLDWKAAVSGWLTPALPEGSLPVVMLKEIVTIVEESADQVRSIATASEQQSAASEEINRAVEDINRISGDTAQAMSLYSPELTLKPQ